MTTTTRNRDFQEARRAKKDEFYTSLRDTTRRSTPSQAGPIREPW